MSSKINNFLVQNSIVYSETVLKAVHLPLMHAGIALIPTLMESHRKHNSVIADLTVTFINLVHPNEKIAVHYMGHDINAKDTLRLILELNQ